MERLGYYAMDKDKNLFQYEWGANEEFYIMDSNGDLVMKDPKEYEILEVGYFVASCCKCEKEIENEDEVKTLPTDSSITFCEDCYTKDEGCQEMDSWKFP